MNTNLSVIQMIVRLFRLISAKGSCGLTNGDAPPTEHIPIQPIPGTRQANCSERDIFLSVVAQNSVVQTLSLLNFQPLMVALSSEVLLRDGLAPGR